MQEYPDHTATIVALKRVEGQLRGIQRMVEERQYCVDILNQVHAAMQALAAVEDKILDKHFDTCVSQAMRCGSRSERTSKLKEISQIIRQFRKL